MSTNKPSSGNDAMGGAKGKRRSMGGGLEEGVSSQEKIGSKTIRDEGQGQRPKSSSESCGEGMTIVQ